MNLIITAREERINSIVNYIENVLPKDKLKSIKTH